VTGGWLDLPPRAAWHSGCPPYPPDYAARQARAAVTQSSVLLARHCGGTCGRRGTAPCRPQAPIGPSKIVAAVTLPSLGDVAGYNPGLHILAMSIG